MVAHVLAVPLPAQGHINPMMRLCRMLANHGVQVTFVDVDPIHSRIQEVMQPPLQQQAAHSDGSNEQLHNHQLIEGQASDSNGRPVVAEAGLHQLNGARSSPKLEIRRAHVPIEGFDLSNDFAFSEQDYFGALNTMAPHLHKLLLHLNQSGSPVTCIIYDFCMTIAIQNLGDAFHIPRIVFNPASQSCQLLLYYLAKHPNFTKDRAVQAVVKQPPSPSDRAIFAEGLEGLPSVIRATDLPHFHHVREENQFMYDQLTDMIVQSLETAHAVLVNSFDELEGPAFKSLASQVTPPIYGIGPLTEPLSQESSTSLWKEDEACMLWLEKQPPLSVLYISFGSITLFSQAQFDEIVNGILSSNQRFLWVVRPNIVQGASNGFNDAMDKLMREERGCIVEWAPQLKVLAHPSIGGFLTHCGWNSTMEAIYHGIPMLCWPYFADQPFDAKYIVEEWKIGLRFKNKTNGHNLIGRREVDRVIRALMQGEDGKLLRENAKKLKEACYQALSLGGTSYKNINTLLDFLCTLKN